MDTVEQLNHLLPLATALMASALIGLEREFRYKSAGLRTHSLVGVGSALFVLVSKFGFLTPDGSRTDTSRVAAQIVTGIGFIGAGLIVLQRDRVRGLTSAAVIWLTAAVGMACGAGLWVFGFAAVVCHYVIVFVFPLLLSLAPRSKWASSTVRVSYLDGRGTLRDVLTHATSRGFMVENVDVSRPVAGQVEVALEVRGGGSLNELAAELDGLDGVTCVQVVDDTKDL
ncbi:MAG: MgtC/SapB family protein [Acidimicrobiales bacterium]|nr:MgtC/SapB family protein [Acidimicrobiales bacterium]